MKSTRAFLVAGLGAAVLSTCLVACGGQLPGNGPGSVDAGTTINSSSTIDFIPGGLYANRFPNVCGVSNPPFVDGDEFSLQTVGAMVAGPLNSLEIDVRTPGPTVGTPIALAVMDFNPQGLQVAGIWYPLQYASAGSVTFVYEQGNNPTEIDSGAFDAATVTILRMPAANGEPFTVRLQLHFVDGQQLDETFSGAIATVAGGCPAG